MLHQLGGSLKRSARTVRDAWWKASRVRRIQAVVGKDESPIIVGPWMGEVGPELQYWIPYVLRLKEEGWFDGRTVIAISRGGVGWWYGCVADSYVDVFDHIGEDGYRAIASERKKQKQLVPLASEEDMIARIARERGIGRYAVLHPSVMWDDIVPCLWPSRPEQTCKMLSFEGLREDKREYINIVDNLRLPQEFVVAKFYGSPLFPDTEENRRFVDRLVNRISKKHEVVVLGFSKRIDPHKPIAISRNSPNVRSVDVSSDIRTNLGVQSEVLYRATKFVGTWGGFYILSAFVGRQGIAFYNMPTDRKYYPSYHEVITDKIYRKQGSAHLAVEVNMCESLMDML